MNRTEWTVMLADAIRPTAAKAASTQIDKLLRLLADIPGAAFTEASVAYVATRKQGNALTLAWLRATLEGYVRTLDAPAPPPQDSGLSAEHQAALNAYYAMPSRRALSMLRRYSSVAFRYLVATDTNAAAIAEAEDWLDGEQRQAFLRRDWDDPPGIMRKAHACGGQVNLLRVLACAVGTYAPQHLGLVPPHVLAALINDHECKLPAILELRDREERHAEHDATHTSAASPTVDHATEHDDPRAAAAMAEPD